MKNKNNFIYLLKNLREKLRISVKDTRSETEVWYRYFSPLGLLFRFLVVFLLLVVILASLFVYTPLLNFLPGASSDKSREELIESILRLDSMEHKLNDLDLYTQNVTLIMEGKQPIIPTQNPNQDTISRANDVLSAIAEDSVLRRELEGEGVYKLVSTSKDKISVTQEFIPPVKGEIVAHFDAKNSKMGVSVSAPSDRQVMAVDAGVVVLSTWSPDDESVLMVQHSNNIISVYKGSFTIIKQPGDRLRSGEVLGFISSKDATLNFELWRAGVAVDPENYIIFSLQDDKK